MATIKGRCEPAFTICTMLGGVTKTAKLVGLTQSGVSLWLVERGTSGRVPQKYWPKILKYAAKHKIKITIKMLSGI